jgi:formyl-CoA transferase
LPGIAPTNAYQCADGAWAIIAGNGDSIFKRLMHTIGRDDLGQDPALADNAGRVVRVDEIDAAIGAWAATLPGSAVLQALEQASVPAGRIYTIADIAADPHYAARGMLSSVALDDGTQVAVPGFVPKLSRTPGSHRRNAPALGQDTEAVLREVGITDAQLQALRERGVIGA